MYKSLAYKNLYRNYRERLLKYLIGIWWGEITAFKRIYVSEMVNLYVILCGKLYYLSVFKWRRIDSGGLISFFFPILLSKKKKTLRMKVVGIHSQIYHFQLGIGTRTGNWFYIYYESKNSATNWQLSMF